MTETNAFDPQSILAQEVSSIARTTTVTQGPLLHLPRIAIKYCTQCKWMLRAAYLAQELLSTFSTSLGEVALVPATGGVFTVTITYQEPSTDATHQQQQQGQERSALLWDRKSEGGFPETKELKSRVRNIIDPSRDLGHVDRALEKKKKQEGGHAASNGSATATGEECEECTQ